MVRMGDSLICRGRYPPHLTLINLWHAAVLPLVVGA